MNKIIFLFAFAINIVNGLSINYNNKGLRRYRNSVVFNIGRNIKHDHCPIVDYFETRQKKVDDVDYNFKWDSFSGPWLFDSINDTIDNYNEGLIDNMLEQHGEISLID
jgi:hypothetical protein